MSGPRGSEAREATRGSAVRLGAEVAGRVLSLGTSFLVASSLGVEAFGVFAAASGIALVLAEGADVGLQSTAARALVARTLDLRAILRAKLALSAAMASLILSLAAAGGPTLLSVLLAYYVLAGWSELLGVVLRARGCRAAEAAVLLAFRGAGLAAVALVLRGDGGLLAVSWALAASAVPSLLLGAVLVSRPGGGASPATGFPMGVETAPAAGVGQVLRQSWPLAVNGGLALLSLRVELFLLFALRGAWEAGLFAAALKVVESLSGIPAAVAAGAMPALTREALRGPAGSGSSTARSRTAVTVALLAVPAAAGVALLATGIAAILGPGYAGSAGPLRLLAPALVALFMNVVLLHCLIAAGRAEWLPRLTAVRLALAAALGALLVPVWGAAGGALGFLAAEATLLVLAARATAMAGFGVAVARPMAFGCAATLPMAAAIALWNGGTLGSVGLGILTYGATLAAAWRLARTRLRIMHARAR